MKSSSMIFLLFYVFALFSKLVVSSRTPCTKLPDPGPGPCLSGKCLQSSPASERCPSSLSSVERVEDKQAYMMEDYKAKLNVPIAWCPYRCDEPKTCCWKQNGGIIERGISIDKTRCFCLVCRHSCQTL
ncbi:uncharacterized protein LOC109849843 [Asparagus officinalis]|uniref:uncharacterized protein LOC109849843 n=1 Tax=Asparagus officinalis TaxID=4686 RepID=UPI00098E52D1|nr:uncharacterized protein LOC109849843 [Asparagus officinalis]